MRYRNETLRALQLLPEDYTLGDVIYAAFQKEAVKNGQSLNFLRRITDEDLYNRVEQVVREETKEIPTTEVEFIEWVTYKKLPNV